MTTVVFATNTRQNEKTMEDYQAAFLTSTDIVIGGKSTFRSNALSKDVALSDTNCKVGECCCQKGVSSDGVTSLVFTNSYATTGTTLSCHTQGCRIKFPTECPNDWDCRTN